MTNGVIGLPEPSIMWWAVPSVQPRPISPLIPRPNEPLFHDFRVTISANSQRPRHHPSIPKQQPPNQKQQGEAMVAKQLTGLDVLWAMQRAAAEKNKVNSGSRKKNKKRKGSVSEGSQREEDSVVDCSKVKPLCIKSEWSARLDELEQRLGELSDNNGKTI